MGGEGLLTELMLMDAEGGIVNYGRTLLQMRWKHWRFSSDLCVGAHSLSHTHTQSHKESAVKKMCLVLTLGGT